MSSLHLCYDAAGLDPDRAAAFIGAVGERACRRPDDRFDAAKGRTWAGVSVAHPWFPCGGISADDDGAAALVTGSIWDGNRAAALAVPGEVLAAWRERPAGRRELWSGVFGLAVVDPDERSLTVVADRFGALPVYWRVQDGTIRISTQLKVLAEPGREHVDEDALVEYMANSYVVGPRTLIRGVHRLPAHHALVCSPEGVRLERLPDPGAPRNRPIDDDTLAEFDAMVARTMDRFAAVVPHYAAAFSGGLDSRLVVGAALRSGRPVSGFTIGERGSLEFKVARELADEMGVDLGLHRVEGPDMPRWFGRGVWLGEGRCLANHMHYMDANLAGAVPDGPLLHGLIAEAIMGGYSDNPELLPMSPVERRDACREMVNGGVYWPDGALAQTLGTRLAGQVKGSRYWIADELWDQLGLTGTYSDCLEFKFRFRGVGMTVPNLIGQVTPWTDVVTPFLDREIFEFCNTLEASHLIERQMQLHWAERCFPEVTGVPRVKDGILIPVQSGIPDYYDRAMKRRKVEDQVRYLVSRATGGRWDIQRRGTFPFYGAWYRRHAEVRRWIDGIVLSDRCLDRGLWSREGVQRLADDLRVGRDTWNALGTILLVEIFIRQFIEGTDRPDDPRSPLGYEA